ncbi:hypothetical protein EKD04_019255 [Chloroflexales bacterium ZM16-3]|nr:hypothetical protein [Chloroflexales bacterium ZM16-3]
MRRSLLVPGFVGVLFAIMATACGTSPAAVQPSPVPEATAAAVATVPPTDVPPTDVPPTDVPPTDVPTAAAAAPSAEATAALADVILKAPPGVFVSADTPERAGMYIIGWLGNCNDCHSPGWGTRPYEGRIPMENWLMGGERNVNPAGLTYSANLRLVPEKATLEEFQQWFKTRENPRMPWNYFHGINDQDLASIYSFLKSLGPMGEVQPVMATLTPVPTVDPALPTATAAPAAPAVVAPTATPRPDLLAPDKIVTAPSEAFVSGPSPELAGEYIIWVGRCNSCHTADRTTGVANWTETTPKDDWLMGGRKQSGNYGTVYSANLRLVPQNYTEEEFVSMMHTRTVNPTMPWFALHQFNEKDLRSVYAFLKSLGPKGDPVPPFVPPAPVPTATP